MSSRQAVSLLADAKELQRRDDAVARRLDAVDELLAGAVAVRSRAAEILASLEALPGELARNEAARAEALEREQRARTTLAEAEARLAEVSDGRRNEEARAQARRELARAAEGVADAAARIARVAAQRATLVESGQVLKAEGEGLAVRAEDVAVAVAATPRVSESGRAGPGRELAELVEWGARVHAALFVVRGGLASERERIVIEASTMGAMVLGEQLAGSSVELVRRRLESHFGTG